MKRKMVFGVIVLALFVLQAQAVFAQNVSFRMYFTNGGGARANGQNITDRIQSIGGQVRDSSMVIIIEFRDGSDQTFAFIDIDELENVDSGGKTTWSNVRMVNPNTGMFFPELFVGASKMSNFGDLILFDFQVSTPNNRSTPIFLAAGTIRFL